MNYSGYGPNKVWNGNKFRLKSLYVTERIYIYTEKELERQ